MRKNGFGGTEALFLLSAVIKLFLDRIVSQKRDTYLITMAAVKGKLKIVLTL